MFAPIAEMEEILALEAADYALATQEINPYGEAEILECGLMRAVYTGVVSPVHGVFATGIESEFTEQDWRLLEKFFLRKERAPIFYTSPATHESWLVFLNNQYRVAKSEKVFGSLLADLPTTEKYSGTNTPDLTLWPLCFTRERNSQAKESDLLAHAKIHQKNTRFYLNEKGASYIYFAKGAAFSPLSKNKELTSLILQDARSFGTKYLFTTQIDILPLIYERKLHDPI